MGLIVGELSAGGGGGGGGLKPNRGGACKKHEGIYSSGGLQVKSLLQEKWRF